MKELTYLKLVDCEERAMFGGHLRSREYIETWPYVEDDGQGEVFSLTALPFSIQPIFLAYLQKQGCATISDAAKLLKRNDEYRLMLDLSPTALVDCSSIEDFAAYLRICQKLGLKIEQVAELAEEAERKIPASQATL